MLSCLDPPPLLKLLAGKDKVLLVGGKVMLSCLDTPLLELLSGKDEALWVRRPCGHA